MALEFNSPQVKRKTYPYLDFFKAIGLLCVIVAHVNVPSCVSFIRSFDVPFLVMTSATLAFLTDRKENYFSYVWKRIKRLIFPSWAYLTFCTIIFFVLKIKNPIEMIPSFLFQKYQFGFVWIIGLYFIMALIVPCLRMFFLKYSEWSLVTKLIITIIIFCLSIVFEVICETTSLYSIPILEYTLFYLVPYGIVSFLGILAIKVQKKWLFILSGIFLIVTIVYGSILYKINGTFIMPNEYNQPARFYYISFSLTVGFLFYAFFRDKDYKILTNSIIIFLSRHSLWIYLWHSFVNLIVLKFSSYWILSYLLTLIISCLIVYIQNLLIDFIHTDNKIINTILNVFRG